MKRIKKFKRLRGNGGSIKRKMEEDKEVWKDD